MLRSFNIINEKNIFDGSHTNPNKKSFYQFLKGPFLTIKKPSRKLIKLNQCKSQMVHIEVAA